MKGGLDLSGQWDGIFAYPAGRGPETPFLASIVQRGNRISGSIIEPDLYGPGSAAEASIIGVAGGDAVDFTKTYVKASRGYGHPVDYVGQVEEDGNRIRGVWSLLEMNGTFEMTRQEQVEVAVEKEEKVELDQ